MANFTWSLHLLKHSQERICSLHQFSSIIQLTFFQGFCLLYINLACTYDLTGVSFLDTLACYLSLCNRMDAAEDAAVLRRRRESIGLDLAGANVPLRPPPLREVDPRRLSLYLPPTHNNSNTITTPPSTTTPHTYRRSLFPPYNMRRISNSGVSSLPLQLNPPYHHNRMTDSLSEDIQRLSSQQQQIQGLMRNGQNAQQQFYLHDQVNVIICLRGSTQSSYYVSIRSICVLRLFDAR